MLPISDEVETHTDSYELADWFHGHGANKAADIHHQRNDGNEVLRREEGNEDVNSKIRHFTNRGNIISFTSQCMSGLTFGSISELVR